MIQITPTLAIEESEFQEEFVRASGPGGQHVNKSSTAVQLRFNILASSLPEAVQERLRLLAGQRVSGEGVLLLEASQSRSQLQNREAARQQLVALIRQATHIPKKRRPTRPSRAARQRRLEGKRRHSEKKRQRRENRPPP